MAEVSLWTARTELPCDTALQRTGKPTAGSKDAFLLGLVTRSVRGGEPYGLAIAAEHRLRVADVS